MSFGIPYKGSKSAIARDIVDALPAGTRLVDLFCGGCAVTDYARRNTGKYSEFLVNDIDRRNPAVFMKAIAGGFMDEDRWISRDDFFRLKETDDYARICFSFGNNGKTYMYGPQIEPYKRAIHHIVFWEDYAPMQELCPAVVDCIHEYCDGKDRKGRRLALGKAVAEHVRRSNSVEYWQSNPMLRAVKVKWTEDRRGVSSAQVARAGYLENLELYGQQSLQSLQSLERLQPDEAGGEPITSTSEDYRNYEYREGDIVYCDPPYAGTEGYGCEFDHDAFWEWARTRTYPVYVSEYQAPDDFIPVWEKKKRSLLNGKNLSKPVVEKLFVHRNFA
jgi:16S rRNA G966 N2-methylase RsmD